MDLTRLTIPQRISLASMAVVVIAAFLPWVSLFGISARGTDGDGMVTLVLSLVGIVVLVLTSGVLKARRRQAGSLRSRSLPWLHSWL